MPTYMLQHHLLYQLVLPAGSGLSLALLCGPVGCMKHRSALLEHGLAVLEGGTG